jgi:hypothetical protein
MDDASLDAAAQARALAVARSLPDERFITRKEASAWLKAQGLTVEPQTLADWTCHKTGPLVHHFGRRVFYRVGELRTWVANKVRPAPSA